MSTKKKKGLSADEKRKVILEIYHDRLDGDPAQVASAVWLIMVAHRVL
jgi:hypothetical protein